MLQSKRKKCGELNNSFLLLIIIITIKMNLFPSVLSYKFNKFNK